MPLPDPFRLSAGTAYLVGGAVRDRLLGRPVKDQDYVVVGATPEDMLAQGFVAVGKAFPVFLHPQTHEEYALARTERRDPGVTGGFRIDASAAVSLEDDLRRRDLTVNALAMDAQGGLYDPCGGERDLKAGILRHVSAAFRDDPVRLLRVARFAGTYRSLGFTVAPETLDLMRAMVAAGDVDRLVPERVWAEFSKAVTGPEPAQFLRVLRETGALERIAPEIDRLYGVPQVATHHPEIDTGIHTEMVLEMAVRLAPGDVGVAFAALTHDLGKGLTPPDVLPRHPGHEQAGLAPLAELSERWSVPAEIRRLAEAVCTHHLIAHQALEVRTGTLLELFDRVDAFRRPDRFERFVVACEADKRGRLGRTETDYPQGSHLRALCAAAAAVSAQPFVANGLVGEAVGRAVREARLRAIQADHGPARRRAKP